MCNHWVSYEDEDMDKLAIERNIWIDAPREQVWQAVTDVNQFVQWFLPNMPGAVMKRDDSGKVTVFLGEMGVDIALMDLADPLKQMSIRSLPEKLLTTTYTFDDERGGTQVKVNMTGFEALPEDMRQDRFQLSSTGWEQSLKNLQAYVDGAALPFPQAFTSPLFGYWREFQKRLAIERNIWINAPRERVWNAVTDPTQFPAWFSPTTTWNLSALDVGGRYYVENPETNTEMYVQVIEALDSHHQIVLRALPEPPDTVVKTQIYTLVDENGGTRLYVTLIGYEPEAESTRWGHMEQDAFGFGMMLQNIKAHAEGQSLPFPWGF